MVIPTRRDYPPFDCPQFNNCRSEQCPLNPNHNVEDILPSNKCQISMNIRLRIAEKYEDRVYLPYDGRTRKEYNKLRIKLYRNVEPTKAELRAQAAQEKQRQRQEELDRNAAVCRFRDITKDLSIEELNLLIEDINSVLHPSTTESIIM
jgi:hypothetical protein